ncbi:hypothetical protein RUMHYD_00756 [Blautia hydrogenotrophica DSM 10507]|uniref:Uncharacterized protein n=1 Tax=Blautia hydrogenotrophica (strain DSM 10507 / JCM 14656 / S5a33) TaxID=476272 RepID=C0CIT8_BLAHS|nr:hypothetical protein RUMHYD_00756 [Blautia hydrogenotrophica DSM 10507]
MNTSWSFTFFLLFLGLPYHSVFDLSRELKIVPRMHSEEKKKIRGLTNGRTEE